MPLRAEGESNGKAFLGGVLSGVVEPVGAVLTLLAAQLVIQMCIRDRTSIVQPVTKLLVSSPLARSVPLRNT